MKIAGKWKKWCQGRCGWVLSHRDIHTSDCLKLSCRASPLLRRRTSCMNMLLEGRGWFLMKSASQIYRPQNQLITVFQRQSLRFIERWAFRLSETPLLARFHSNGESGRLDEVCGRRRWVRCSWITVKNLRYKNLPSPIPELALSCRFLVVLV